MRLMHHQEHHLGHQSTSKRPLMIPKRPARAQGNLLDDKELVGVLGVTKATAGEVNARLAAASEARKRISDACEEYRPVAHRAQLLYFLVAQFSTVNAMYQTSLAQARACALRRPLASVCTVSLEMFSSGSGQGQVRPCDVVGCRAPAGKIGKRTMDIVCKTVLYE